MNVKVGRYWDVTGLLREKTEAKTTTPKIGLLSQQNPTFVPQKQGHKNIQKKFQKLYLRLELKTIRKMGSEGILYENPLGGDGSGSQLPTVTRVASPPAFSLAATPFSFSLLLPASFPLPFSFSFCFSFGFSFLSFSFLFLSFLSASFSLQDVQMTSLLSSFSILSPNMGC